MKDTIQVFTTAPPEEVFKVMCRLEMIKVWEPSHRLPSVRHEWSPETGMVKEGNILRIITPLWRFEARCAGIGENEIRWEFTEGPLKGCESWRVEQQGQGAMIVKHLEYEVRGLRDGLLWRFAGRCIHHMASRRQLKMIKYLTEDKRR